MLPGEFSSDGVLGLVSSIQVNGVTRAHKTWSISRSIKGQMPDQVAAGGGITQATGTVEWALQVPVSSKMPNPWNPSAGWVPRSGDRVQIWVGTGTASWRQFTGFIDKTDGAVSTLVDGIDQLNRRFAHQPLLRVMPPRVNAGPRLGIGLFFTHHLNAALRAAGFYTTPKQENRCAVSVPAQGSMWPEQGTIIAASAAAGSSSSHAVFHPAPWGHAASDFLVQYIPTVRLTPDEPVESTVMVDFAYNGNYFQTMFYGSTSVQLAVAASRTVVARLNGATVCSLVLSSAENAVALLIKAGVWTLRTNTGRTVTGNAAMPASPVMSNVTFSADSDSRVAGMQICYPSTTTEFRPVNFTPSATIETNSGFVSLVDAAPTIDDMKARDFLEELSKATLTAMWLDEEGTFRAVPSDVLRNRAPVGDPITTREGVFEISWSDSLLSVRESVYVDYQKPYIDDGGYNSKPLYQGSVETLGSGQRAAIIVSPKDDEDWIGVDTSIQILGEAGSSLSSNSGQGSITGAVLTDGTTEQLGDQYLTASVEQLTPRAFRIVHQAVALPPGFLLELRYPTESSSVWTRWLGQAFAILRGFARTDWVPQTRFSEKLGPEYAPALVHDALWMLSREDNTIVLDRVRDFLLNQVATPSPVMGTLRVVYDPRRQVGDVIPVRSDAYLGVRFTCLIVTIQNSSGKSFSQELGLVILSTQTVFTTYEQFNAQNTGALTYEQWSALAPTTQTYSQFNTTL